MFSSDDIEKMKPSNMESETEIGTFIKRLFAPLQLAKRADDSYLPSKQQRDVIAQEGIMLQETLGEGRFSKIRRGFWKKHKREVAVKIIPRLHSSKEFCDHFFPREVATLRATQEHPLVVDLYAAFESPRAYYLVLEYCSNGDLLEYVNKLEYLHEAEARRFFRQLLDAVQFLHHMGIVHRDVKLDNVLLNERYEVRLADFGFARFYRQQLCATSCGSFVYAAPELFAGQPYNAPRSDVWSLGVCLYAMLCGRLPFVESDGDSGDMHAVLLKARQKLHFTKPVESDCRQLTRAMLQLDPCQRPSLAQIKQSAWISRPVHVDVNEAKLGPSWTSTSELEPRVSSTVVQNAEAAAAEALEPEDPADAEPMTSGKCTVTEVLSALARHKTEDLTAQQIRCRKPDVATGVAGRLGRQLSQLMSEEKYGFKRREMQLRRTSSGQVTLSSDQLMEAVTGQQQKQLTEELRQLKETHAGLLARAAKFRAHAEKKKSSAKYTAAKLRWKAAMLAVKRQRFKGWRDLCSQLAKMPRMDIEGAEEELEAEENFDFSQV